MKKKLPTLKELLHNFGPGIVTSSAGNDPTGITTYALVGATTGFSQLWLVLLSCPLLIHALATCARLGDVAKKGLSALIKEKFGRTASFLTMFFLILTNLATLGANFAGVSSALGLFFPKIWSGFFPLLVGGILLFFLTLREYKIIHRYLLLLSLLFLGFVFAGFIAKPDWNRILAETIIPQITFTRNYFLVAVAFLGTTISPFLFYWQVTEEIENHPTVKDVKNEFKQIAFGVIFATLITYFVVITSAIAFFQTGNKIQTATDAALGLYPLMGKYAYLFFAIGLIASGLLAITVIASSTAYAVAETFGWREGLTKKVFQAKGFYTVLTAVLVIGVLVPCLAISPLKLIFYSQVLNGILAPPLLALVTILASSGKIMGKFKQRRRGAFFNWLTVFLMSGAVAAMFASR